MNRPLLLIGGERLSETPEKLRGLTTVRLEKNKLLDKVRANRDEHRKIFEEAIEGWKKAVTEELERMVDDAKNGVIRLRVGLQQPQDHTKEYDAVIDLLEMSEDTELELTYGEFQQFARDEWGWQRDFLYTSSQYSSSARSKFNQDYNES